jgi:hypothetical protein
MKFLHSLALVVMAPLAVTACAKPPPPPILSMEGRQCTALPDLATAHPVSVNEKDVSVTLDDKTGCLDVHAERKLAYVAFGLPATDQAYLLSVTSIPIGEGLFFPKLTLLDGAGKVLREIPPDVFLPHGAALHAGLRPHPDERFLIVSSDPATIGQTASKLTEGIQVNGFMAGGIYVQVQTGAEGKSTLTHAYNGTVTVKATLVPIAK